MRIKTARCWTIATVVGVAVCGAAVGCGSSDDSAPAAPQTPSEVRANLEDAGYIVGDDITDGANTGVAQGGKLDADVYFSVDAGPDGNAISAAGIYFFATPEDAQIYAQEREHADCAFDCADQLEGNHVYAYAGSDATELDPIVAAGEGND